MFKNLVIFICFQIKSGYFLCFYIDSRMQKSSFCIRIYDFHVIIELFY